MDEKYKILYNKSLICPDGKKVYRIKALRNIADKKGKILVKKGDIGGFVHDDLSLSQEDNSWVYDDAIVRDSARVSGDACIKNFAIIRDYARVCGNAVVQDSSVVSGHATVKGFANIRNNAKIENSTTIEGHAVVGGSATVKDFAQVCASGLVCDYAVVGDHALVSGTVKGHACCSSHSMVCSDAIVSGHTILTGNIEITEKTDISINGKIGTNLYNDELYVCSFKSPHKKIIRDNTIKNYKIVPISDNFCVTLQPLGYTSLFVSPWVSCLFGEKFGILQENFFFSKVDLWREISDLIKVHCSFNSDLLPNESLLASFFKTASWVDVFKSIKKLSKYHFQKIVDSAPADGKLALFEKISEIIPGIEDYLFAYFLGIMIYLLQYSLENSPFKHREVIRDLLNDVFNVDLKTDSIIGINEEADFYSFSICSMIVMLTGVCLAPEDLFPPASFPKSSYMLLKPVLE